MAYSKFKSALLAVSSLGLAVSVQAAPIAGEFMADNNFMVVHQQNGVNTIVYTGANGSDWKQRESFSFSIPESAEALRQCSVKVILWGDGNIHQGLAGGLKGPDGTLFTGGPGIGARMSSVASVSPLTIPNAGQVNAIITDADSQGYVTPINRIQTSAANNSTGGTVFGGTWPWGAYGANAWNTIGSSVNPAMFHWIASQASMSPKRYSVFNFPCDGLVTPPPPPPPPMNMPGEHFQCYNLEKGERLKTERIRVEDQFGKSQIVLGAPRLLCNPSAKIHNDREFKIENEKRHLVCYDIVKQEDVTSHNLAINNQFAYDEVISTKRQMFCVPSSKDHLERIASDGGEAVVRPGVDRPRPQVRPQRTDPPSRPKPRP